ncbi:MULTISPECIES: PH domain-containing protein [Bacteria]|uniref:PH domain-containing protein n=1 Tax=Bacteria TaxID=2 RepID=UPI003C7AEB6E
MTNTPQLPPDGDGQAVPSVTPPARAAGALDEGVYTTLREPQGAGALALDGVWHQISPKYVVSQVLQNVLFLVALAIVVPVLVYVLRQQWAWIPGGVLALFTVVTLVILPRQARAIGYMLRADDIVFRKGILWQRMIAVPYGRMQLVDITHGPLDRAFGVAKLKMVTAAATTGVEIPGMNQAAAEVLRDTLIEVAETRRTGL